MVDGAGQDYSKPYYWFDNGHGSFTGHPLTMMDETLDGMALGITTFESNVYIAGYVSMLWQANSDKPDSLRRIAAYWINGDRVDLYTDTDNQFPPQEWIDSIVVTTSNTHEEWPFGLW